MLTKLVCVIVFFQVTNGARILGIIPSPSYSHQVVFQPLWRELSLRGHQVTTLTTDLINDPLLVNLTEIDLSYSYKYMNEDLLNVISSTQTNIFKGIHSVTTFMLKNLDNQLQYHKVQDIIKDEQAKFDLVIAEYIIPSVTAFAEKFKCPLIGVISLDAPNGIHELFGNPVHPILYPDFVLPFSKDLTLLQRLISVLYSIGVKIYLEVYVYPSQQSSVYKNFGSNYPTIKTMVKNTSLLFINSDPIFHPVRALVPAVIPIGGGSHRTAAKPLPKDLQKVLDAASSGFIYFSLGSNVKSKDIPVDVRNVILETFSELPFTVLWKFESDELPNKPRNIFISKWLPQQDVLKHPNIKLFITQGGVQSMDEAIYDHVPMIGMPYFGDQAYNVQKMVERGFGLSIDHKSLDKEHFKRSILEVINNPKYRKKIKELAELASDQPMTGLERAIWWTEYVLRHKGAQHLRSPALDIPLYQYLLLDVIGVLLLAFIILIFTLYILIKAMQKIIGVSCSKLKSKLKQQ